LRLCKHSGTHDAGLMPRQSRHLSFVYHLAARCRSGPTALAACWAAPHPSPHHVIPRRGRRKMRRHGVAHVVLVKCHSLRKQLVHRTHLRVVSRVLSAQPVASLCKVRSPNTQPTYSTLQGSRAPSSHSSSHLGAAREQRGEGKVQRQAVLGCAGCCHGRIRY
jgi:hypothetical protein